MLSIITHYKYDYSPDQLVEGELFVLRSLDYKLNRYSIYAFIVFFFSNGLLVSDDSIKGITDLDEMYNIKKRIEKIYIAFKRNT